MARKLGRIEFRNYSGDSHDHRELRIHDAWTESGPAREFRLSIAELRDLRYLVDQEIKEHKRACKRTGATPG